MLSSLPGWKGPKPGAQGLARLGGLGLRGAVGLGVLSSVLGAAGEFADAQDPAGARGNLADATGMGLGSALAGGAVIAPALLAGGPIGIGTLVLGSLAAAAGGQLGKGAVRGLADAGGLTSSDPVAKDLENSIKAARAGIALKTQEAQAMLPLQYTAALQDLAIQKQAAAAQQELTMAQNYQNAMLSHILGSSGRVQDALSQALGG